MFSQLKIASAESFEKHLNRYNVIKIDLNAMYSKWLSLPHSDREGDSFIGYVAESICSEFLLQFPDIQFPQKRLVSDYIQTVYAKKQENFVVIIDEYDVLVREQVSKEDFDSYLAFLVSLFKNSELKPAIALAYITGILPVIKDKIQSKLNTFQ